MAEVDVHAMVHGKVEIREGDQVAKAIHWITEDEKAKINSTVELSSPGDQVTKTLKWREEPELERPKVPTDSARAARASRLNFDYDEDARIGIFRPSMKENPLLHRADPKIGKSVLLQTPEALKATHGIRSVYTGSAAECLTRWPGPQRPKTAPPEVLRTRFDYVKFNKVAIDSGLVSVREQQALREVKSFYRPATAAPPPSAHGRQLTNDRAKAMVHGVSTLPSDDITVIMRNAYGREWVAGQQQRYRYIVQKIEESKFIEAGSTKTSLLRQKGPAPQPENPFVLKQFQNIQPVVSTFRSAKSRERAMLSHSLDGVARLGKQHQGAYAIDVANNLPPL